MPESMASEPAPWPNKDTLSSVEGMVAEVDAIAQRAANEGFGALPDDADDAVTALKELAQEIRNLLEAWKEEADGGE